MITEDYVSFETAKLLKEKGFDDVLVYTYYLRYGDFYRAPMAVTNKDLYAHGHIAVPTLQMAMKWLREVYNLFVFPFPQMNTNKFWIEIYQLSNNQEWKNLYCKSIDLQDYLTCESACEAGIKYCLENLI